MKKYYFFFIIIILLGACKKNTPKQEVNPDDFETFYEKSNFTNSPSYSETVEYCKKLADASPFIEYQTFGKSAQNKDLPVLIVNKNKNFKADSTDKNLKVFIQAAIHPGEADGKDAMLVLLRDIFIKKYNFELLDNITIIFVPIFNVDGHERSSLYTRINQNGPTDQGWRTTAQNYNLNRDFVKADSPEMRAWLKLYNRILPEFFIDLHTTDGADYQYTITYDLNINAPFPPDLKNWITKDYLSNLEKKMEADSMPIFPYVAFRKWHDPQSGLTTWFTSAMLSTGYASAKNRVGLLVETHMLKPYKQRVDGTYKILLHTLEILNREDTNLKEIVKNSDEQTRNILFGKLYPIAYQVSNSDSTLVHFFGKSYTIEKSDLTGGDWYKYSQKDTTFKLWFFNKLDTTELAKIPRAYVVPAQYSEIIELAKIHNLEFTETQNDDSLQVTTYKFSDYAWANRPFEGRFRLTNYEQTEIERKIYVPKGSLIIPTNQPSMALIMHMFEPKSNDSFLKWGFFNGIFEQKEYAETYVMEVKARQMLAENPELKHKFEQKKLEDPNFANSQWLQLNWFYQQSEYWDETKDVYPIGKIF